jgi:hypothetical protein
MGYGQMYYLEFANAHETFSQWQRLHANEFLGPASDAATVGHEGSSCVKN